MGLSLRELRDIMVSKGGYSTATPPNTDLIDLKNLLIELYNGRVVTLPADTGANLSGTTCAAHSGDASLSKTSLSDISAKVPSTDLICAAVVNNATCGCVTRTLSNVCDTDIAATCTCNTQNQSLCPDYVAEHCNCYSRTPTATCSGDIPSSCGCQYRTGEVACQCNIYNSGCNCVSRTVVQGCVSDVSGSCSCRSRTGAGSCDSYYGATCTCNGVSTPVCVAFVAETCNCLSRTTAPACTCNTRCTCNTEKRFQ